MVFEEKADVKKRKQPRIDFDAIRRTATITAVLDRYGLLADLKPSGLQLKGRCSIHGGSKTSRSFVVDPTKNVWHCFSPSCARGGGSLELVAELENVDVRQAAILVARWFAISSGRPNNHRTPRRVT